MILSVFTLELEFINISTPDKTEYEVLNWKVLETDVNKQIYHDDDIVSEVIHDFECENFPEINASDDGVHTVKLSVNGTYTRDYYGEVDLNIDVELNND